MTIALGLVVLLWPLLVLLGLLAGVLWPEKHVLRHVVQMIREEWEREGNNFLCVASPPYRYATPCPPG